MGNFLAIGGIVIGSILATFALVGIIAVPVRGIDHHMAISRCESFAEQSHYETKFVDYNFWEYDCLVKQRDGHWISGDNLRSVNDDNMPVLGE